MAQGFAAVQGFIQSLCKHTSVGPHSSLFLHPGSSCGSVNRKMCTETRESGLSVEIK